MPDTRRLLMLSDVLEDFHYGVADLQPVAGYEPPTRFDLHYWYAPPGYAYGGGASCTLGVAMFSPKFQAEGLGFVRRKWVHQNQFLYPTYKGAVAFDCARKFFDLDNDAVKRFFTPSKYTTQMSAWHMANLIRDYVQSIEPHAFIKPPVDTRKLPALPNLPTLARLSVLSATLMFVLVR